MPVSLSSIFLAAFFALFRSSLLPSTFLVVLFLVLGYGAALWSGIIEAVGIAAVIVMLLLAWLHHRQPKGPVGLVLYILFLVWAGLLFLHLLPGFNNPTLLGPVSITADAVPFTMRFNLDKVAIGFAVVLFYRPLDDDRAGLGRSLLVGLSGAILAIALTLPIALWLGAIRWEPKFPDQLWLWALNNFLLVAFTEEALFRGFLQTSIARYLEDTRGLLAIPIAAVMFGLVHFASGVPMIALAALAGIAYGAAYRYGGLLASALAHFGLNLFHILLFTYPLLAQCSSCASFPG
jgi:uncharacterized protein